MKTFTRLGYWLCLFLFVTLTAGCDGPYQAPQPVAEKQGHVIINGYTVPVFPTVAEQLNYTRSWFVDPAHKRAALLAVSRLFPEKPEIHGRAALDLAFMELGPDYRLAGKERGRAAVAAYEEILDRYAGLAQIGAKATWYIAWIHADILNQAQKGITFYRRVVGEFPNEAISLLPPAPWVSIIEADGTGMDNELHSTRRNTWAALALLEIIRIGEDEKLVWESFADLWHHYPEDVALGFALRLVLERGIELDRALKAAREYLHRDIANAPIKEDIERLMAAARRDGMKT